MISKREMRQAESVSAAISAALERRGMKAAFRAFYLTRLGGLTLHISVLDAQQIGDHARYINPQLLHQLRTELRGMPVYLSNTNGIRYVTLMSGLPRLPKRVPLPPDVPAERVMLGVQISGAPVGASWESLRHIAVLGISGSGKSAFLRLLAHQAVRGGMRLALADLDGSTFAGLAEHPALVAPLAETPSAARDLVQLALAECDRRAKLYRQAGGVDNLTDYNRRMVKTGGETLPRWLVALDEASAVLTAMGGGRGALGQTLAMLGWRGRKFGVHFVFAAQEFTKEAVGAVREQAGLAVCFRVRSEEMARRMGCAGASRIPESRPGLAVTDRWGVIQTYYADIPQRLEPALKDRERSLFLRCLQTGGVITRERVMAWGEMSEWQARKELERWALCGWAAKDKKRNNAYTLTDKIKRLLSNAPTSPASPTEERHTLSQEEQ